MILKITVNFVGMIMALCYILNEFLALEVHSEIQMKLYDI